LPPPFRALLGGALAQTARELNKGVGLRLADQMETTIGERCRLAIEGRYPFTAASGQDMALDDFARIFAVGGLLDDFFQRTLSPHVDTSGAVWRYRMPADDVPPVPGPSLAPFQRARQIREAFFRGPDPGTMGWRVDVKVTALDPEIVELNLDFDGQSQRYVHGPVVPLRVAWPGPAGRLGATLAASPPGQAKSPPLSASGAWALMRVIAKGKLVNSINQGHFQAEYDFDGRKATLDISTGAAPNPWTTGLLQGFRCPARGR
jgi:type VI secretion system protein ImpL